MDDNNSHHSEGSVSNAKATCPYCDSDLQLRAMFKHIYVQHHNAFLTECNHHWLRDAEKDRPLKCIWERKDDFGDTIYFIIYATLGTNKTFSTEKRAITFLKKDKEAREQHKKEITKLIKSYQSKKATLDPFRYKWDIAKERNDPDLIRAIWRSSLMYVNVGQQLIDILKEKIEKKLMDPSSEHRAPIYGGKLEKMKYSAILELFEESKATLQNDMKEKNYLYDVAIKNLVNLQRVVEIRDYVHEWIPIAFAYFKTDQNPNGQLYAGSDDWGIASDEMPEIPE